MRSNPVSRRFAAGFVLALLFPLASALAGFGGTDWYTEGRIVLSMGGLARGGYTSLEAVFPDESSFSLEDPDGLFLTGTMTPLGRKGTRARGELDPGSEAEFASQLEDALEAQDGGTWEVTPDSSSFSAKLKRGGTRIALKLKLRFYVWSGAVDRTRRFKLSVSTRTPR